MASSKDQSRHGEIGHGFKQNLGGGVFGDISTIIGKEELGFGSIINPMQIVEKFDFTLFDEALVH